MGERPYTGWTNDPVFGCWTRTQGLYVAHACKQPGRWAVYVHESYPHAGCDVPRVRVPGKPVAILDPLDQWPDELVLLEAAFMLRRRAGFVCPVCGWFTMAEANIQSGLCDGDCGEYTLPPLPGSIYDEGGQDGPEDHDPEPV